MALGSNLEIEVADALSNSNDTTVFSTKLALAINNYLSNAEYASGAILYTNTLPDNTFELPTMGTAVSAATQISNGVMLYWGASGVVSGVVSGVIGSPIVEGSVITLQSIIASTVATTLLPLLTAIFSDITPSHDEARDAPEVGGCNVDEELIGGECVKSVVTNTEYKAKEISDAIKTAIATIVTVHTETIAPSPSVIHNGGIE